MSWNEIVGNDRIKKILQRQITENRVANSYLFAGIEGIGKEQFAIQFAKTINCISPIIDDDKIDSCQKCKSCKMFDNFSHPNFEIIYALPTTTVDSNSDNLSETIIDEIKQQFQKKIDDPYSKIKLKNANFIRVTSIREIKKKLSLTQSNVGKRFILISEADKMNSESANAFLKTLEEPGENIIVILSTSKPDKLLPTIKSRCQIIKFAPIDIDLIIGKLKNDLNINNEQARMAANISMGSLTKALEIFDDNFIEMRDTIVDTLRSSLKKKQYRRELSDNINKIIKKYDKELIITLLQILTLWIKDAENIRNNYDNISNVDNSESIRKFATNFKKTILLEISQYIEDSINLIQRNVNIQGVIFSLFLKIRKYLLV